MGAHLPESPNVCNAGCQKVSNDQHARFSSSEQWVLFSPEARYLIRTPLQVART
jgi:hypothetical protein